MQPELRFLRLKNGDDLICECVELSDTNANTDTYEVVNPLKVVYVSSNIPGAVQVGLTPWMFKSITDETSFEIKPEDVIISTSVSVKMAKCYWDSIEAFSKEYPDEMDSIGEDIDEEDTTNRTFH